MTTLATHIFNTQFTTRTARIRRASLLVLALSFSMMSAMSWAKAQVNSVVLTSSVNPVFFGSAPAFTVKVTGPAGSARPTGTAVLSDSLVSGGVGCTVTLSATATANLASGSCFPAVPYATGTHNIIAVYNGDANYNAQISDNFFETVLPSYRADGVAGAGGTVTGASSFIHVPEGNAVTFFFTANPGFHIVSVTASPAGCGGVLSSTPAGSSQTRFDSIGLRLDCTFTAQFAASTFNVTFIANLGGAVNPSGTLPRTGAATTSVTATPSAGFRLTNVTGCGIVFNGGTAITGSTTWTTAPITADCSINAFFIALPTFAVTAAAGAGGSISPQSVAVPQGLTTQFTVTPASGFQITSVTGCGGTRPASVYTTGPITAACAVTATFMAVSVAPTTAQMIEYRHPPLDYYFITSRPDEIALLDATPPFVRTGQSFLVFTNNAIGAHPITRFYFDKVAVGGARGSHFYTLVDAELLALVGLNPSNAPLPKLPVSEGVDSFAFLPLVEGVGGSCAAGLIPVYRLFRGNARFPDNPNHRFTTSTAVFNDFVSQGWDGEGVKLCVPG